jgi:hypothetical protein
MPRRPDSVDRLARLIAAICAVPSAVEADGVGALVEGGGGGRRAQNKSQ